MMKEEIHGYMEFFYLINVIQDVWNRVYIFYVFRYSEFKLSFVSIFLAPGFMATMAAHCKHRLVILQAYFTE